MNLIGIKEAAAFLKGSDGYLIYTHANPDGDTLGSSLALAMGLRQIGKQASVFSVDGIPEKLSFLPSDGYFASEPECFNGVTPISVDVAGPKMLFGAKNTSFKLAIDHHKVNTVESEMHLVMADKIACGEIIFMLLEELGADITKPIAEALYTAMCSDSGGFRYSATTAQTHIMAAKCLDTGIDFAEINRKLFECKSRAQIMLIKTAYRNLELLQNGRFAFVAVRPQEAEECGAVDADFDCVNSIPREIAGVEASAVVRQKAGSVKISLRSNADIDVAEIAKKYGGGGHYHAAGLTLDCDFDTALNTLRSIFSEL